MNSGAVPRPADRDRRGGTQSTQRCNLRNKTIKAIWAQDSLERGVGGWEAGGSSGSCDVCVAARMQCDGRRAARAATVNKFVAYSTQIAGIAEGSAARIQFGNEHVEAWRGALLTAATAAGNPLEGCHHGWEIRGSCSAHNVG